MLSVRYDLRRYLQLCQNSTTSYWRNAIDSKNPSVNALVYVEPDTKIVTPGPLQGLAIAIKDNICTASMPTTCSSAMMKGSYAHYYACSSIVTGWISDFTSPFNATVVDLLRGGGAAIVGKTNCDEFGMGYVPIL
jgi:aspartyl-tRNA(Asn)/glutamyl-tRNA(Gln) amidotransferase subunit A